ncbi:MAG: extracellular matrix regulator RemB [Methanomassiliicoccales archaeon]
MFLHLGNDYLIGTDEIVAIVNLDNEYPLGRATKDIIELGIAERKLIRIGGVGKEKSLIITGDKIYLSPISSTTLQKRGQAPYKEGY